MYGLPSLVIIISHDREVLSGANDVLSGSPFSYSCQAELEGTRADTFYHRQHGIWLKTFPGCDTGNHGQEKEKDSVCFTHFGRIQTI
jgi:hypothetical protein